MTINCCKGPFAPTVRPREEESPSPHAALRSFMLTTVVYSWGAASMGIISSVMLSCLICSITYTMIIRTRVVNRSFPLLSIPLVSGAFFPLNACAYGRDMGAADAPGAAWPNATGRTVLNARRDEKDDPRYGRAQMQQRITSGEERDMGTNTHGLPPHAASLFAVSENVRGTELM